MSATRRNTTSALLKNGKFDLNSSLKKTIDMWNFNMKQTLFYSTSFAVSCVKKDLAA